MVSCGVFSPDGRQIVTGSLDATARIWDIATGKELHRLVSRCGEVATAVFSPDGKQILAGGKDGVARALGRHVGPHHPTVHGPHGTRSRRRRSRETVDEL